MLCFVRNSYMSNFLLKTKARIHYYRGNNEKNVLQYNPPNYLLFSQNVVRYVTQIYFLSL